VADHRDVQRMEQFLREWFDRHGARAVEDRGDQYLAVGEIEEQTFDPPGGYGHWRKLDGGLGCYPGTLQIVNITALARDLVEEQVKA
jgi:hypothetical protein